MKEAERQEKTERQLRDRRAVERASVSAIRRTAVKFRADVLRATREKTDTQRPVGEVVKNLRRVIATSMTQAHFLGKEGASQISKENKEKRSPEISLSSPFASVDAFLKARISNTFEVDNAIRVYDEFTMKILQPIEDSIHEAINRAAFNAIRENLPTQTAVHTMRKALDSAGVTSTSSHLLETVFRTQSQIAYSAGRAAFNATPDVDVVLWGYEYVGIGDSRQTDICRALDGMRLKKDNPAWNTLSPPNHYNCRSSLIEIFDGDPDASETRVPSVEPARGFAFNPATLAANIKPF